VLYPLVDLFLKPSKKILYQEINALPDGELLEIGVGNGSTLQHYRKHWITAIDISPVMLSMASNRLHRQAIFHVMNAENLAFENEQFKYIVLSHVIAVVNDPEKVLLEAHRVLKPGGKIFILNHITPDNWIGRIDYGLRRFAKLFHFDAYFTIEGLHTLQKFSLIKELKSGRSSYFKLFIYQKNEN
jgi:phosphatidylethanolamine/phosphatidyl-N-methylethanolamine N-methyltransferase